MPESRFSRKVGMNSVVVGASVGDVVDSAVDEEAVLFNSVVLASDVDESAVVESVDGAVVASGVDASAEVESVVAASADDAGAVMLSEGLGEHAAAVRASARITDIRRLVLRSCITQSSHIGSRRSARDL